MPSARLVTVRTVLAGLLVGLLFVGIFLAALHDPRPRDLPVTLAGPDTVTAPLREELVRAGDALAVSVTTDVAAANDDLAHRRTFAVYEPATSTLTLGGANGPGVTQTLTAAFGAFSTSDPIDVVDAIPLPQDDSRGLSTFYVVFGAVLGGFLTAVAAGNAPVRIPPRMLLAGLASFALLLAAGVTVLADPVVGALPDAPLQVALVVALLAMAVSSTSTALIRLLGPAAGTGTASLLMLILGNATSGATLPAPYLPDLLRPLHGVLPAGVAVDGTLGAVHFNGAGLAQAVVVLAAWSALGIAGVILAERRSVRGLSAADTAPSASAPSASAP